MHTSNALFCLFLAALVVTASAQVMNYLCIDPCQRTTKRKFALCLGLIAIVLSGVSGYKLAVDWSELPNSPEGLRSGELWNDGGIPAIVPKVP